jgi:predicted nucleic acid-binding protein
MLVVADTSPLNYLVWIEVADILPRLYGQVIIPPEVLAELLAADAPLPVRAWANALPHWIEVQTPDAALRDDPRWQSLDEGERAAIALATTHHPSLLLIDERAGSAIARGLGLSITGTLGVLDEAARQRLIALPDAIQRLKQTSFRYPKAIVQRLLEEDARR